PREGKAATRAEREALAAARLRHERCLRAYGLERDSRNVYIAYEYVPGQTMREALRAGELDDAAAVETAAQVLEGLAHAHARGIVHRDVKPSNVLLAEGEGLSARLLDFGLAQLAEEESLTATGDERLRRRKTRTTVPELSVPLRLAAPAAAALFAGWTTAEVAFYPTLFAPLLAVIAGALMLARPRIGLAFTLAVPILPLGNVS